MIIDSNNDNDKKMQKRRLSHLSTIPYPLDVILAEISDGSIECHYSCIDSDDFVWSCNWLLLF